MIELLGHAFLISRYRPVVFAKSVPNPTNEALERVKPEKRICATSHHAHHETEIMFVRDRKQIKTSPSNQNHVVDSNTIF